MDEEMRERLETYCPELLTIWHIPILMQEQIMALAMDALRRKMVEKGDWLDFYWSTHKAQMGLDWDELCYDVDEIQHWSNFTQWLIEPIRFYKLVGEWLERKVRG